MRFSSFTIFAQGLIAKSSIVTDWQRHQTAVPFRKGQEKKYSEACAEKHVNFTPLCFSIDGLVGGEVKVFIKVLGNRLASLWNRPYSNVIHWLRAKLSFTLIRAADLCL